MAAELPLEISATIGEAKHSFLIDTGSSLSILPYNSNYSPFLHPTGISLTNASGSNIKCYGELNAQVNIPSARRSFKFTFVVADVMQPILGLDFLSENGLIVDPKNRLLIDSNTKCHIPLKCSNRPYVTYSVDYTDIDPRARAMLLQFPILSSPLNINKSSSVPNGLYHRIDTEGHSPVNAKPRPLSGLKLKAAKDEFQFLLDAGRIERSNSPWSSPLHLVPKKEPNEFRPCGDYRILNSITTPDKYPVPHLRSITMSLHDKHVFSKLDLQRAYLQIPVAPEDVPKTAVCTPFGLFNYLYMPYGLKNAGATFQRYMDTLFANIPNVFIYLDDVLIASKDETEHCSDLQNVLKILSDNNLRLTPRKCQFFKTSLTFLGYEVSTDGIRPPTDRVTAISEFPLPENTSDLRRFMGCINFFRQMIPNFADIAYNVTELLRLYPKCKALPWTDEAVASFNNLKQALIQCPTLKYPSADAPHYHLVTDSSNYAVGAALYQIIDNEPHPINFFSKKLSQTQKTYSTFDRELLAAYLSVLHFKTLIDGHQVTLFVDHKPIVSAFYASTPAKSDKQQRHLSFISEYVSNVQYICGRDNVVADFLSRPICATSVDVFDLSGIARAQSLDSDIDNFKCNLTMYQCSPDLELWCDTSTPTPRPYVPLSLRPQIIQSLHNLSHPGVKTTTKLVKQRYFWPSMDGDVKLYVNSCLSCQQSKISRHTKSPIEPISAPSDRFQTVHIDIVGPLAPASIPKFPYPLPFRYLLTCIDRATRWS